MIQPGSTLAHYEIVSALGKGGMGEVWRARDSKLGREVAIKTLPEEFAKDEERLARFEREAKLLASLNHPNIATIHGLEEDNGTRFLVLELVEGDTLAERLNRGAIPVEESLRLALQIAEALEAAHEKGVIHRDLKPANIKVTPDGKVKVLDFGLAKAFAGDGSDVNLSQSPTLSMAATQQGVILGTAAYMSPEQARGVAVDKRADIWAFGCVLYEMLTGRQVFRGELMSDVMASVLKSDPDYQGLPPTLHPKLRDVLRRCLEKEPKQRWQDVGDVRVDLERVQADPDGVLVRPDAEVGPAAPQSKLPWVAALVVVAVIAIVSAWTLKPGVPVSVVRFDHELADGLSFRAARYNVLAVSSDGRSVVYNTSAGLYLLSVDEFDARLIPGTEERIVNLTFSPDSLWLAYWSAEDQQLQKISVNGGAPVVLAGVTADPRGMRWGEDDTIVYALPGGIWRVSATIGTPEQVLISEEMPPGRSFAPQMLPGGDAVLFGSAGQIFVQSLDAGEPRLLVTGLWPRYVPTGHLVYSVDGSLFAQGFDLANLQVIGGPVPVLDGVSQYALSETGTLAYSVGIFAAGTARRRSLVWVDRDGAEERVNAEPRNYVYPRISPSGEQVLLNVGDQEDDIWVLNLERGTLGRRTFSPEGDSYPAWTPNDERIAFSSRRTDGVGMYWKAADNTGSVAPILLDDDGGGRFGDPYFFTPDGAKLVFREAGHPDTLDNIAIVSVEGDSEPEILLNGVFNERNAELSPDGNWMAYESNESGQSEIYVRPFPNVDDGLWQISNAGGEYPLWSRSGGELFYIEGTADQRLMATPVETGPTFDHENPQALFEWAYTNSAGRPYDVSPDGQRFLVIRNRIEDDDADVVAPKVNVILNWFEELKEKVPAP